MNKCEDYTLTIQDFKNENYQKCNGIYVHPNIIGDLNKPIFRYMQFGYLLEMLGTSKLYVPNRINFRDQTEKGRMENLRNRFLFTIVPKTNKERKENNMFMDLKEKQREFAYNICISCWTYDAYSKHSKMLDENYLMWKTYTSNGVGCRIETTIHNLISSINNVENIDILISKVSYVTEHINDGNVQHYIFEKPVYYRDEKEVRLCILKKDPYINLTINPFQMIKKIILSPFINKRHSDLLIEGLKNKYPDWDIRMEKSHIME